MNIIERVLDRFSTWLLCRASGTPYFHLHHADGSLYMGRYWWMPRWALYVDANEGVLKAKRWLPFSVRVHHLATPDYDTDMHDHPAAFLSIVLSGGYLELRPYYVEPVHVMCGGKGGKETYLEAWTSTTRLPGSIALRLPHHRHRIAKVRPGTVTLCIWFRKVQWWGFYTRKGKVHWRDYESVHNSAPVKP